MTIHTRKLLFIGSIVLTNLLHSNDRYIKSYPVDPEVGAVLDTQANELSDLMVAIHKRSKKHGVWQFECLPDYYVKYGLARISGMEKMLEVIDRCNLDCITVADKRLYHIKGRSTSYKNLNYAVVVKSVEGIENPPPVTLDEVLQLCRIMHETGYISMTGPRRKKGPNYIRTEDGKICLIDTESRYDHENLLEGFLRFLDSHRLGKDITKEALQHIFWEIKQQLKQRPKDILPTLKRMRESMKSQQGTPSWDYYSYFKKYFKDMRLQTQQSRSH